MKRLVWFCILFAVVASAFAAGDITNDGSPRTTSRKLKEGGYERLDDYAPVDPSPSSKAVIPGPIEHGTPLIPYIPRPWPPNSPSYVNNP